MVFHFKSVVRSASWRAPEAHLFVARLLDDILFLLSVCGKDGVRYGEIVNACTPSMPRGILYVSTTASSSENRLTALYNMISICSSLVNKLTASPFRFLGVRVYYPRTEVCFLFLFMLAPHSSLISRPCISTIWTTLPRSLLFQAQRMYLPTSYKSKPTI